MSTFGFKDEIEEIVKEKANEEGISVDKIEQYKTPGKTLSVRVHSYHREDEYAFEIPISPDMVNNGKLSAVKVFEREVELHLREMKEAMVDRHKVNGHQLDFNYVNGFEAKDRATGESWHYTPKDVQTDLPISPPTAKNAPTPRSRVRHVEEGVLTEAETERMRMYVIGWALEYSPQEWFQIQEQNI